jgi:hypothetical protein
MRFRASSFGVSCSEGLHQGLNDVFGRKFDSYEGGLGENTQRNACVGVLFGDLLCLVEKLTFFSIMKSVF